MKENDETKQERYKQARVRGEEVERFLKKAQAEILIRGFSFLGVIGLMWLVYGLSHLGSL